MIYVVLAVHDDSIEVWDGGSWIDPSHPGSKPAGQGPATMLIHVGQHDFKVTDRVQLVVQRVLEATPADG